MRKGASIKVEPGRILRSLAKAEVADLIGLWFTCYGEDRLGVNTRSYIWHVFSYERYPCVSGLVAEKHYSQHEAVEYVILSNRRDEGIVTDLRPTACSLSDWIVFPPNLAWTMAFTHEDGWLGPYFARSPSYAELNAANVAQIRKAREVERARQKGWK